MYYSLLIDHFSLNVGAMDYLNASLSHIKKNWVKIHFKLKNRRLCSHAQNHRYEQKKCLLERVQDSSGHRHVLTCTIITSGKF